VRAFCLLLSVLSAGCLEDRLGVDITTEVRRDGSCHRRTVYTLERLDTQKPGERLPIDPQDDPLRLHRFPQAPPWSVRHDLLDLQEVVVTEADLDSPNSIGSDYLRLRKAKVAPSRNQVTFGMDHSEGTELYWYSETFIDPASPVAAARLFARLLLRRDEAFARDFLSRIEGPRLADVRRAYRESLALPIQRAVAAIPTRSSFSFRERAELERTLLGGRFEQDLTDALKALAPGADEEAVGKAVDASLQASTPAIEAEMAAAGLPMDAVFPELQEKSSPVHFTARLVLPIPITRANTCFENDTASWEFDQEDLYGRGFEMWARAAGRPQ
jgi:hypothetical protein